MDSPAGPSGKLRCCSRDGTGGSAGPGEPGRAQGGTAGKGDPAELPRARSEHFRHLPAHIFFFLILSPEILFFFFFSVCKKWKTSFSFSCISFSFPFCSVCAIFAGTFPSSGRVGYLAMLTNWSGGCVCFSALPCLRSRKSSLKPLERLLIDASSLPLDSLPAQEDLGWDWETRRHFRLQNTLF